MDSLDSTSFFNSFNVSEDDIMAISNARIVLAEFDAVLHYAAYAMLFCDRFDLCCYDVTMRYSKDIVERLLSILRQIDKTAIDRVRKQETRLKNGNRFLVNPIQWGTGLHFGAVLTNENPDWYNLTCIFPESKIIRIYDNPKRSFANFKKQRNYETKTQSKN